MSKMDSRGALRSERVSFGNEHQSQTYSKGKLEPWTRAHQCLMVNEKPWSPCGHSLEIPHRPIPSMEFLCRSWSPSASNFFQIFSSNNLLLHSDENCSLGEHEVKLHDNHTSGEHYEEVKIEDTKEHAAQSKTSASFSKVDNIRKWLTIEKSVEPVLQRRKSLFTSFFRRKVKTKEEDRLHTANIDAALSVTRLAAAIAGFAANTTKDNKEEAKDVKHIMTNEGKVAWDKTMGNIVASAAALIATICAEAAESIGANRTHVASAVNSGLATQDPADMMTLTATAATCMRGAAILTSRAMEYDYFARKLLEVDAQLPVITPSDKISHVKEEAHGNFSISLKSNCGDIKLWFEDENQSLHWISVISSLLQMHNSC
uniref:VAN3-binding protein-like auxin canalisation domain-containing protein n=1 Tax=Fagus sylvatica TaxID=28930 RepID=A0A2N9GCY4_FAGSY